VATQLAGEVAGRDEPADIAVVIADAGWKYLASGVYEPCYRAGAVPAVG
jgi:hypothetical protein